MFGNCNIGCIKYVCFSTSTISPINAATLNDADLQELIDRTYVDQKSAVSAYENLIGEFGYDEISGDIVYPEDYGGAYINDEAKLVVLIKGCSDERISDYQAYCKEDIITVNAKYSLVELKNLVSELKSIVGKYDFYGIDEINNEVDVYIDPSDSRSTIQQNLSDYPIEIIRQAVDIEKTATISSGGKIYNAAESFSLCAWATLSNGTVGIVTCGHTFMDSGVFQSSRSNVYANSTLTTVVGTASSSRTHDSGSYDCAFITKTSSIYSPTATMVPGGSLSAVSAASTGTFVYKYGAVDGMAYGRVTYSDSGYYDHTNYYTIDTTYNSNCFGTADLGDSGGPIYTINSNNQKILVGIVMGKQGSGDIFYGTSANLAFNKLGASLYTG